MPRISAISISVMPRSQLLRATTAILGVSTVLRPPPRLPRPRLLPTGAPLLFFSAKTLDDSLIKNRLAPAFKTGSGPRLSFDLPRAREPDATGRRRVVLSNDVATAGLEPRQCF